MAAKLLANLIVMGSGILLRGFAQAYRQALANAQKTGVAQETVQHLRRGSKAMTVEEARKILGVAENSTWEEILSVNSTSNGLTRVVACLSLFDVKYDNMFERNMKNGSFYLQSKVHRAKECLETVYQKQDGGSTST